LAESSDILGVKADCSKEEIKTAFAKLAKKYHPDTNPQASELYTEIAG
jgi:molecular chaperone DnaJ